MADKTVNASGVGTLPVSGPGVVSSVTVTDAAVLAGDKIIVTPTTSVADQNGPFGAYAEASPDAGSFTVYANKAQLPTAMTFNYIAVDY